MNRPPVTKSRQTIEKLRRDIGGSWKTGARIPTEPELCERYGVSRVTLREAVSALSQEGVLYRHQGRGTFVVDASGHRKKNTEVRIAFFPDLSSGSGLSDPMVSRYAGGVFAEAAKRDARIDLHAFASVGEMERYLRRGEADAAILLSPRPSAVEGALRSLRKVVVVNAEGRGENGISLRHHAGLGSHLALKHLTACGAKKIALLHRPGVAGLEARLAGARESFFRLGLEWDEKKVWTVNVPPEADPVTSAVFAAKEAVMAKIRAGEKPDAIFAMSDRLAIGALRALREYKIACPKTVRVMGYDGISWGEDMSPPLSTVQVPAEEMGALAVRKVLDWKEGLSPEKQNLFLEPELVLRESA